MKKHQAELNWWAELSGWLERHQGSADYLFVYDQKQGKLDRCFDRNVTLRNVDAETVSRLYQAAAEGRLGMLRPKDLKPQLLNTDPVKMFSSGKEVPVTEDRAPEVQEQEQVQTEQELEQPVQESAQPKPESAQQEQKPVQQERESVQPNRESVQPNPESVQPKPESAQAEPKNAQPEPEQVQPEQKREQPVQEPVQPKQENGEDKTVSEMDPKPETGKQEWTVDERVVSERLREAEEFYRQVMHTPPKPVEPSPVEVFGGAGTPSKRDAEQSAVFERAVESIRNAMPMLLDEGLGQAQEQFIAGLVQMMMSSSNAEEQRVERIKEQTRAREGLIAAQNLFIWAAASDKRDREQTDTLMQTLMGNGYENETYRLEWTERMSNMARELQRMDLDGASETACNEKIRDFLDGKKTGKGEASDELMAFVTPELWGNTLRHLCRFAASEVPLSVRHVQVAEQCSKIKGQMKKQGLSLEDLGLNPQDKAAVDGTIEMGKLVYKGLLAQAALSTGQRLPKKQYQECLKDFLAMKGIEEALVPHISAHQEEISTGDGPVSALQIVMGHAGFRAADLAEKAGRTVPMARLREMNPLQVTRMVRQGGSELAAMGLQVIVACCQMGSSVQAEAQPVQGPKAPQVDGPKF